MADSILPSFLRPNKSSLLVLPPLIHLMPDAGVSGLDYGQI